MVLKSTIVSGMLAGSLALGALVTYNGGAIIDKAQIKLTEQASALGIMKTQQQKLVETLTAKKAELEDLKKNGTAEDQATIDKLTADIAEIQKNVDSGSEAVANRINDLEAEVNKANTDAAELDATLASVGETPTTMLQSQMDQLTDSVPEGYALLKMINETPQWVYDQNQVQTKLQIDKTVADLKTAHLIVINNDQVKNYKITINGATQIIAAGATTDLGLVKDLDAKTITINDTSNLLVGKYYLIAQ